MEKKEFKIFLIAVLAVVFVSLVTQIISGFVSAISLFTDAKVLYLSGYGHLYEPDFIYLVAAFLLVITLTALSFVVTIIFMLKNNKRIQLFVNAAISGSVCLIFIVFAVVLRCVITYSGSNYSDQIDIYDYELFQQFLTVGLSDLIAIVIVFASWLLLAFKQPTEQTDNRSLSVASGETAELKEGENVDSFAAVQVEYKEEDK